MMVLIGNIINVFRCGERLCEVGCRRWFVVSQRHVVEMNRTTCERRNLHCVGGIERGELIGGGALVGSIKVRKRHRNGTERGAVDGDGDACVLTGGDVHRQLRRTDTLRMGDDEAFRGVGIDGLRVEEVAAALVPAEAVDLIERVIIVGRGIEAVEECGGVYRGRRGVILGEEIITITGIGIARAACGSVARPAHRTAGVEQTVTVDHTGRHLFQVIMGGQLIAVQHLILQIAAIAVDLHAAQVAEAGLPRHGAGELIHTRFRHPNLRPTAGAQHRMGSIARRRIGGACGGSIGKRRSRGNARDRLCLSGNSRRLGIDTQHEAHQYLVFAIAIDQRTEVHIEHCRTAVVQQLLAHHGKGRQRVGRQPVVVGNVGRCHVDELGIDDGGGIDGVAVVGGKGDGIAEMRQYRIDTHLFGSEVEEPLRTCRKTEGKQNEKCIESVHIFSLGRARLLAVEVKYLLLLKPSLEMVVDMHRSTAGRCSGEEQVTRLERERAAQVGDGRVDGVKHR